MRTRIIIFFVAWSIIAMAQIRPIINGWKVPDSSTPPPTSNEDTININLHKSTGGIGVVSLAGWNNWGIANGAVNASITSLVSVKGVTSPMTITFSQVNDFNDNGAGYGAGNVAGFPAEVFRASAYNTSAPRTITFTNVPAGNYKFQFLSSRNTNQARQNSFQIGSVTSVVDAWNNTAVPASIDNVSPVSGTVTATINHNNGFNFVNAIRIIRHEDQITASYFLIDYWAHFEVPNSYIRYNYFEPLREGNHALEHVVNE